MTNVTPLPSSSPEQRLSLFSFTLKVAAVSFITAIVIAAVYNTSQRAVAQVVVPYPYNVYPYTPFPSIANISPYGIYPYNVCAFTKFFFSFMWMNLL
jgi:hypothetical protein